MEIADQTTAPVASALPIQELAARLKAYRLGDNPTGKKIKLTDFGPQIGLPIGTISQAESGKGPISMKTFRKYHAHDPERFPLSLSGLMV